MWMEEQQRFLNSKLLRLSQLYRVGVSFPSRNMTGVIKQTTWDLDRAMVRERTEIYFNFLFVPLTFFLQVGQ